MLSEDLVKSAIRYRGVWNSESTYEILDCVIYNGDSYISVVSNTNVIPGSDINTWKLASPSGTNADSLIDFRVEHMAEDSEQAQLSWDAEHIFGEIDSLSFTMDTVPDDDKEHHCIITFDTPDDMSEFTFSADQNLIWPENSNPDSVLAPSSSYEIYISSVSMIGACNKVILISSIQIRAKNALALPVGATCRPLFLTDAQPETISFSSSNTNVLTVDESGNIYGVSSGSAVAYIRVGIVTTGISVTVGSEVVDTSSVPTQVRVIDEIAIINPIDTIEVGDEYALYAVGISNTLSPKYDIGYYNPIKWTSSDPAVAVVMYGTLMANGVGTCTITASDLNSNASSSFSLSVTAAYEPTATSEQTYIPTIDNTGETDVTADIAAAISYAASNGYKKISFPQGDYLMSGDNRPDEAAIQLPSNMIIDFNGSNIYFDATSSAVSSGYTMFQIVDKENLWFRNVNIYAENYGQSTLIKKESNRTMQIYGLSKNIHVENCFFGWATGFNVTIGYSMSNRVGFRPNSKTAGSVEAGGLDDYGNDVQATATYRTTFRSMTQTNGYWIVGMFQGYQPTYMRSRLYDIFFYDENKTLIYKKRNCYQYQRYYYPTGIDPKYCRLVFFQTDEPTQYDGDFNGFIHICDNKNPKDLYFKDCTFSNAISTGMSPQGGEHVIIDNCTFIDNGYQDPLSHIDWEDGRQSSQGHIVKNCTFKTINNRIWYNGSIVSGQIINGYCRNITFHDNYIYYSQLRSLSESTMQRCFHNIFEGQKPSLGGKCDSVFAGNLLTEEPVINSTDVTGTYTISVDNQVV